MPARESSAEGQSPPPPDLVAAAFHWLEYLGLLGAIGSLVVMRLAGMPPRISWARPPLGIAVAAAAAGLVGLLLFAPSSVLSRLDLAAVAHVLSAGVWGGGILALASLRPPGGWGGAEARDLVGRFGRVAVVAFALTAFTGVIRAATMLGGPSDLWTTRYGEVLALKSAGVLVILALSLAWRRGRDVAPAEAAAVILVVAATALLAAVPPQA